MSDPAVSVQRVTVDADPSELNALRTRVGRAVRASGGTTSEVEDFELAVSELATNVMRHTDAGDFAVVFTTTPDRWILDVSEADGLDDLDGLRRPSDCDCTGRGLFIVRAVMDDVSVVDDHGTRSIRCVRSRAAG
ncbi:ATP-binding protein [Ilumatobacter sp.]|uniref:ATP-binding protein n=1 Tax=Ilumatobacter sp. TaxID=1967498 RepID=UPI003B529F4B